VPWLVLVRYRLQAYQLYAYIIFLLLEYSYFFAQLLSHHCHNSGALPYWVYLSIRDYPAQAYDNSAGNKSLTRSSTTIQTTTRLQFAQEAPIPTFSEFTHVPQCQRQSEKQSERTVCGRKSGYYLASLLEAVLKPWTGLYNS